MSYRFTTRNLGTVDSLLGSILQTPQGNVNYPPYNLIHVSDNETVIEVALAGFSEDEIQVFTEKGHLTIAATKAETDERTFLHRGLATRNFTRRWQLSEDTQVGDVLYKDGLLTIQLTRVVPERHQKRFFLGSAGTPETIPQSEECRV